MDRRQFIEMKIRKAIKEDLKDVGKLMRQEFSKYPFNEKDSIKDILESLKFYFKIGNIFVSVVDEKIIGVVVVKFEQYWEGKVTIIEDLAVDRKFQHKNVGKMLMQFVEDYSKKKNSKFVLFSTNKKSKAIRFYKKLRYKIDKNRISMRKKLK